ncbi:MAG: hypothetical protein ACW99G_23690, partial [Candidatus Thorarchaeota archaeon]
MKILRILLLVVCIISFTSSVWAVDTKISDLTADTSPSSDDLVVTVDDPAGTPANKQVTVGDLATPIAGAIAEGELADSVVVGADIKDSEIAEADLAANTPTLDYIGNPDAAKTFAMGAHELTFGSATDGWLGVELSSSQATLSTETRLLFLDFSAVAKTDTNMTWFDMHASGGSILSLKGAATRPQVTGDVDILASGIDFDSIDNLTVASTSLNDLDVGFTVGQTFTTITATGAIVGELSELDETAVSGDALTAAQLRGTLLTNEGDADGETWELPAAESG